MRLRLHYKAAAKLCVKGLAPVFFGLVFGRGFGGCLRAENSPQSGIGFVGQSGVQVAGIYSDEPIPDSAEKLLKQIIRRLGGHSEPVAQPKDEEVQVQIDENLSQRIFSQLIELADLAPQNRGFAFERFLKDLFDAYGLSARSSFRLIGEQIDGSFVLNKETYLLEAKWQNAPTGAADLHTFEGKLSQKASWSRGLFLSNSGFSSDGLQAFGKGKRIVCMDGFDLSEMLRRRLSVVDVLEAKVRRAAETGRPFIPVRELFV
ncbi:restriction endonuclease [uncultured Marinobacter sp.]|uniref:restriction endonuclease n=1 Tax=uncultured Marinobacter sp. TaxID=187379 RepID=UPI0030DD7A57